MTADGLIDLAHPEAADWLLGTLEPAAAAEFGDHLADCGDCQTAVAELGHVGRVLQQLPPAVEPPPVPGCLINGLPGPTPVGSAA